MNFREEGLECHVICSIDIWIILLSRSGQRRREHKVGKDIIETLSNVTTNILSFWVALRLGSQT